MVGKRSGKTKRKILVNDPNNFNLFYFYREILTCPIEKSPNFSLWDESHDTFV